MLAPRLGWRSMGDAEEVEAHRKMRDEVGPAGTSGAASRRAMAKDAAGILDDAGGGWTKKRSREACAMMGILVGRIHHAKGIDVRASAKRDWTSAKKVKDAEQNQAHQEEEDHQRWHRICHNHHHRTSSLTRWAEHREGRD